MKTWDKMTAAVGRAVLGESLEYPDNQFAPPMENGDDNGYYYYPESYATDKSSNLVTKATQAVGSAFIIVLGVIGIVATIGVALWVKKYIEKRKSGQ